MLNHFQECGIACFSCTQIDFLSLNYLVVYNSQFFNFLVVLTALVMIKKLSHFRVSILQAILNSTVAVRGGVSVCFPQVVFGLWIFG